MNAYYQAARQNGLLPPLAACVAAWKYSPTLAAQIRTLHPSGAAIVFVAAYLACLAGSVAALAVVAAFLAGLYLVKAQPVARVADRPAVPSSPQPAAVETVKVAGHPLADQLAATGLVVREVKLGQPASNGKAPKVSAAK